MNKFSGVTLLACGLLALSGGNARAQQESSSLPGPAGVIAHGHGEVKAKPDVAYALVAVTTQSKDQAAAIADASVKIKAVIAALKSSLVTDKEMQTQNYSVQLMYDYHTTPPTLTGYQVNNTMRVTLHDLPKIGVILDKAMRAGANIVDSVSFDLSDRQRVEGDALALAVADARSKADLMAGAAGITLGRVVTVSQDTPSQLRYPQPLLMSAASAAPATPTPILPQLIDIDANATVVYSIERK